MYNYSIFDRAEIFLKDDKADVFSTYSDGHQMGESTMVIINTVTCEYKKI